MAVMSLAELRDFYRRELLDNILPFWLQYARDRACGGYHTCLNRDGSVYDHDKLCMWCHGRIIWTYSFLYNELERNEEWLEMARWGVDFVRQHGFAPDGSMYYALTREGRPLLPAQDVFTELFAAMGFSEFARATSDEALYQQAKGILLRVWEMLKTPGNAYQLFDAGTRPVRLHGHYIITLNVVQELRRYRQEPAYEEMIDDCLRTIVNLHMKQDRRLVYELVGWNGEEVSGSYGRWINPGHMMEGGIFIIHEGQRRGDEGLVRNGVNLIDWGFERGWDAEFGGIFNDVDSHGLPVPTGDALRYVTKLWWQHAEALHALLLAYAVSRDERFLRAYWQTHDYSFANFADPDGGEWFASLDRRGNRIGEAKGTARKSPFHIARNFYLCYRLLEKLTSGSLI